MAAALWGLHWSGKHVRFHSDNMAVVSVLTSRTAKDPLLLHLLRCFSFYCAHFCFHFSARHIVGVTNVYLMHYHVTFTFVYVPYLSDHAVHHPTFSPRASNRYQTGLGVRDPDTVVRSLIDRGVSQATLAAYESGRRVTCPSVPGLSSLLYLWRRLSSVSLLLSYTPSASAINQSGPI